MDLRDICWNCVGWIDLSQDRGCLRDLVNTVHNILGIYLLDEELVAS